MNGQERGQPPTVAEIVLKAGDMKAVPLASGVPLQKNKSPLPQTKSLPPTQKSPTLPRTNTVKRVRSSTPPTLPELPEQLTFPTLSGGKEDYDQETTAMTQAEIARLLRGYSFLERPLTQRERKQVREWIPLFQALGIPPHALRGATLRARIRNLCDQPEYRAVGKALWELCCQFTEQRLVFGEELSSSEQVYQHFRQRLCDAPVEYFFLVLLDNKHRFLRDYVLSKGTLDRSLVHPREVYGVAMAHRAASLICVHNHPSGKVEPSAADIHVTRRLQEVGKLVGIPLLDHLIIGQDTWCSLADLELLGNSDVHLSF